VAAQTFAAGGGGVAGFDEFEGGGSFALSLGAVCCWSVVVGSPGISADCAHAAAIVMALTTNAALENVVYFTRRTLRKWRFYGRSL